MSHGLHYTPKNRWFHLLEGLGITKIVLGSKLDLTISNATVVVMISWMVSVTFDDQYDGGDSGNMVVVVVFRWFQSYRRDRTQSDLLAAESTEPRRVEFSSSRFCFRANLIIFLHGRHRHPYINFWTVSTLPCRRCPTVQFLHSDKRAALKDRTIRCTGSVARWMASNRHKR